MRELKVLELFSGTGSVSNAFEKRGHKTFRVDWSKDFYADLYTDIEFLKADTILKMFGRPDVIHLSPDCSTWSMQSISKHRRRDEFGNLVAISDYAKKSDRVDINAMRLLRDLQPYVWFIENPRAAMRKAPWIQWAPRNTTTYCQYLKDLPLEQRRMKPTDLWTNIPDPQFAPPCNNGDPCHVRAPRGSRSGTQGLKKSEKYVIPPKLCEHMVDISEDYIQRIDKANEYLVKQGLKPITAHWGEDNEPPQEPQMRLSL